jgi:SAM-dependent methyltransferase
MSPEMKRQTRSTAAVLQLPPQILLFLFGTTAFALYIAVSPGSWNNWWLNPLIGIVAATTMVLVGTRLVLGAASRAAQKVWSITFAVLVLISICQFVELESEPMWRYFAIDGVGDCLLLVLAPVFLWATAKFEPIPAATRRALWIAFAFQICGAPINFVERIPSNVGLFVPLELANNLIDLVTMQLYLIAATVYISESTSIGNSVGAQMRWLMAGQYYDQPAKGLHGKHLPGDRLIGLDAILAKAEGSTILDLGCAEGLIAAEFIRLGAAWVDGVDVVPRRIRMASDLVRRGRCRFFAADLNDWAEFERRNPLLPEYDIVLFLGIYQHLSKECRARTLRRAAWHCGRYLAVRAPSELLGEMSDVLGRAGFVLTSDVGRTGRDVGHAGIYERVFERAEVVDRQAARS